ncbi:hypothetical protein RchiOBHm_Chr1g0314181 [Rosa chinensis]|uniref:Uncharacterized protein n=1 Tax=Rosa chinensis TaxID=74649 RepID=A0A2P6S726_ROSCH|nr:hypothetical protein RchiOBHm_Chr1g0314181 [Rosa chinensis]
MLLLLEFFLQLEVLLKPAITRNYRRSERMHVLGGSSGRRQRRQVWQYRRNLGLEPLLHRL